MQLDQELNLERLRIISGALLFGLSFTRLDRTPGPSLVIAALGSPLGINFSGTTFLLLVMIALIVTCTEALLQGHPLVSQRQVRRMIIYGLMPTQLDLGAGDY